MNDAPTPVVEAIARLWGDAGLDPAALSSLKLTGSGFVLPSSFAVADAAQTSISVAALAAAEIGVRRSGRRDSVEVERTHATLDCAGYFRQDGRRLDPWDKISGLYPCDEGRRGWVRIHANFAHHRDGALTLLGLPPGSETTREAVQARLASWSAIDFESAAAEHGLVVAALRSHDEWLATAQGAALSGIPAVTITRIGDAAPRRAPVLNDGQAPLSGLRVVDLTRILAGPAATRALATYGAEVMLINGPHLPNIANLPDMSRGKRSALLDLREKTGQESFAALLRGADIMVEAYRPGALASRGFGAEDAARLSPGIVYGSLSAYGHVGPWRSRRGFDSLVQTASGFNDDEARAAGSAAPRALPVQILDYASGHLMAFGVCVARLRQMQEGGSWHVHVALATTGNWLRTFDRDVAGLSIQVPKDGSLFEPYLEEFDSDFGRIAALRASARFGERETVALNHTELPGSSLPNW